MGTVKIDDKLLKEIREWLKENDHRYKHPTIKSFVNNAVHEKLSRERNEENDLE